MDQKIQLIHPEGKKAVSIQKNKYDLLKEVILNCLKDRGESTHAEIQQAIAEDLRNNKIIFDGSLGWYIEWVKLDLEARKEIKRLSDKSPVKFAIS